MVEIGQYVMLVSKTTAILVYCNKTSNPLFNQVKPITK